MESICEEDKAGRPVAPPVQLVTPAGAPPYEILESVSEEEKAGRPVAPPADPPPAG